MSSINLDDLCEEIADMPARFVSRFIDEFQRKNGQDELDCNWKPVSEPQRKALESPADILFYGGQAGGGKTSVVVGLSGGYHWRSVIFRNTYKNLSEIITQSHEHYCNASYNGSDHVWRFNTGREVDLAYLQYDKDKHNHMGVPRDLYCFDEITQFKEDVFRYVIGWNRTKRKNQRCRVICTGNAPIDAAGEWVIDYWAPWLDSNHENPAEDGELRWFVRDGDKDVEVPNSDSVVVGGEKVNPRSRTFIRARLDDNPYLRDTPYRDVLLQMPEHLKQAYFYGNFDFQRGDSDYQLISRESVIRAMAKHQDVNIEDVRHLGIDPSRGGKDDTVFAPLAGNVFGELIKFPGHEIKDGQAIFDRVKQAGFSVSVKIGIDVIGIGSSAYDFLKMAYETEPINNSESSDYIDPLSNKLEMRNVRAESYWMFMIALNNGVVSLPKGKKLENELCAVKYKLTASGILLNSKDEIKEDLGRSPDEADAVVLAWYSAYKPPAVSATRKFSESF